MSRPGMGVLLGMLGGNERTVDSVKTSLGKEIKTVKVEDNGLRFEFTDGTKLELRDGGQSCCEDRFMVCDDDLSYFIGTTLTDLELVNGPDIDSDGDVHEQQFLRAHTSRGSFTVTNHNVHNGYYGGFWIVADTEWAKED